MDTWDRVDGLLFAHYVDDRDQAADESSLEYQKGVTGVRRN